MDLSRTTAIVLVTTAAVVVLWKILCYAHAKLSTGVAAADPSPAKASLLADAVVVVVDEASRPPPSYEEAMHHFSSLVHP